MKGAIAALTVAFGAASALAGSVTPITIKGNAFFKGDERFYIRGVDYQPGGSSKVVDPIADVDLCKRDIKYFKELGLNTIRVYTIDNTKNHDECMKLLADAGIYLVLDVNTPKYSINRADPEISYNAVYLQSIFATVQMFAKYDNTLAFFSGNEVINDGKTSAVAPWVKAVTRDIRQFIKERNLRKVPVGYSAADVDSNREQTAHYMNCGGDDERSDFFAFNDYSWCSPSSFETSGWDQKVKKFKDYGIPIFLSEYGCNINKRDFSEVEALYSEEMTGVYSGGLVYEYSQEPSDYGLVEIKGGASSAPSKLSDYNALKSMFAKIKNPSGDGGYNQKGGSSKCPAKEEPAWNVDGEKKLPQLPSDAEKYVKNGAGDGPGLKGPGSQSSGSKAEGPDTSGNGNSGSGSPGSGGKNGTPDAAAGLRAPEFVVVLAAIGLSTFVGASMMTI
ncbi:1,3-beta-glucanosyltransferase [Trichophyton mentagrophytes]|nr:1,3-beta-glucanosyltransferase [Trichophyton mentagrophytes]